MHFQQFMENHRFEFVYHVSPESGIYKLRPTGSHVGTQAVNQRESGIYVAPKFRDAVAWFVSYVAHKKFNTMKRHNMPMYYQNATIYKIRIPSDLKEKLWGSNFWEAEYFIPERYFDQCEIVSKETFSNQELYDMDKRWRNKRYEIRSNIYTNENLAKQVMSTNIAARAYLFYLEQLRTSLLRNKEIDKEFVEKLLKGLTSYFIKYGFPNSETIPNLDTEQKIKVNQIIQQLDAIFK